jgi:hypothetical protein
MRPSAPAFWALFTALASSSAGALPVTVGAGPAVLPDPDLTPFLSAINVNLDGFVTNGEDWQVPAGLRVDVSQIDLDFQEDLPLVSHGPFTFALGGISASTVVDVTVTRAFRADLAIDPLLISFPADEVRYHVDADGVLSLHAESDSVALSGTFTNLFGANPLTVQESFEFDLLIADRGRVGADVTIQGFKVTGSGLIFSTTIHPELPHIEGIDPVTGLSLRVGGDAEFDFDRTHQVIGGLVVVPEPSSSLLLSIGILALGARRVRARS